MLAVNLFISTSKVLIKGPFYPDIYRIRACQTIYSIKIPNSVDSNKFRRFTLRKDFWRSPASCEGRPGYPIVVRASVAGICSVITTT
jgi:hypothetical protein